MSVARTSLTAPCQKVAETPTEQPGSKAERYFVLGRLAMVMSYFPRFVPDSSPTATDQPSRGTFPRNMLAEWRSCVRLRFYEDLEWTPETAHDRGWENGLSMVAWAEGSGLGNEGMCRPTFSGRSPTRKLQRPAVVPRPRFIIRAAPMPGPHQIFQRSAPLRCASAGCGKTTHVMVRMPDRVPMETDRDREHTCFSAATRLVDRHAWQWHHPVNQVA